MHTTQSLISKNCRCAACVSASTATISIETHVPLHDKNWFATGGNALFFCAPKSVVQFQESIQYAQQNKLPIFILGKGANILISDDGFSGLVIQPNLNSISLEDIDDCVTVTAHAGVLIEDLIAFCFNQGVLGLEEFSGIPGTIGGAIFINLHYFEFLIDHFLLYAQVIDAHNGTIMTVNKEWFAFAYNYSKLHERTHYLVNATFRVKKATESEVQFARGRSSEIIRHRNRRYPTSHTCGSFFRLFKEDEVQLQINNKKMIYVGYYLDKVGVKGSLRVGNAIVSHQHANMIVNIGNATSNQIIQLARTMQQLVFDQFGIVPQPECELVGFAQYPLL